PAVGVPHAASVVAAPESCAGTGITGGVLVMTGAASPVPVPAPLPASGVEVPVVDASGVCDVVPLVLVPDGELTGLEVVAPEVAVGVVAVDVAAVEVSPGGRTPAPLPEEPVPELHAALSATGATTAKSAGPANR
ncbi:MAG: hypothetical protein ABSF69_24585, partial [Polyangiaceae bacterium]